MVGEVLLFPGLSSTKVCMKLFNMDWPNFGKRGMTNLQSRLLKDYVESLAREPDHSSHEQEVMSLSLLLLRSQSKWMDDISESLLL
jgi:hypothetical protein